jgi:signal transduction histidine kinase
MTQLPQARSRYPLWIFGTTALSLLALPIFPDLMRARTEGMLSPLGVSYAWDVQLVFWHVITDVAIGLGSVAIAVMLTYFVWNGRDLIPFHWVFLGLGLVIFTSGVCHLMEVWTVWRGDLWASASVKIVAAVAAVATAAMLPPLVPRALALVHAARVADQRGAELAAARVQLEAARVELAGLNALKRSEAERRQLLEREREARTRAEKASRAKDEFLTNLSHELRTPANAIVGWAHMLQTGRLTEPGGVKQAAEAIYRNAQIQARLVDDLLDLSRTASGTLKLERSLVDLREILQQASETVGHTARSRQVTIQLDLPSTPVTVDGDPARLQQIVWNLMSNAVKFTPAEGHVYARISTKGQEAQIIIADTGIGISPEFLPHMFDRFTQADGTTTREVGGLGIGLAIVRQLTELHGGRVTVHSGGLGQGSTFTVHLPIAE